MDKQQEEEEPWIEDSCNDESRQQNCDEDDEDYGTIDLFAEKCDGEFKVQFDDTTSVTLKGIQAKYPMFLQSTGLTLWKSSKMLGTYLCENKDLVCGKTVVELGAGLGLAGIVAHKIGASKVVLTDGDTDTLDNMRDNVASNSDVCGINDGHAIICKQLRWGRNVEEFCQKWSPQGFDVVMGSDIIYAKEYVKELFQTVSILLSPRSDSVFLLSHMKRNPTLSFDYVFECAKECGFKWSDPSGDTEEGIYIFHLSG